MLAALLCVALAACTSGGGRQGHATTTQPGSPSSTLDLGAPGRATGDPIGLKWAWGRDDTAPYIRTIPGASTFFQTSWCELEPHPGHYDWGPVDSVARATSRLGDTLLLKIRVGSCWATGGQVGPARGTRGTTPSAMPTSLSAYQAFVTAVVRRYASMGVHEYAIENEPNARIFWTSTPTDYEKLSRLGAQAVHAADARAAVVDGGVSSPAYGLAIAGWLLDQGHDPDAVLAYQRYYARRSHNDYPTVSSVRDLRAELASPGAQSALAFLAVGQRLAAAHVTDAYQLHFYESWQNVPDLIAYLRAKLPPSFPIEAWEVGMFWLGGPEDAQLRAGEVTKTVAGLLARGVRRVIWLPLSPASNDIRYGLLGADGSVRPAGVAVQRLAVTATGSTAQALDNGRLNGAAFSRGDRTTMVLWSDLGTTLALPAQAGAKAEAAAGGVLSAGSDGLRVGKDPVIVTIIGGLADALRIVR